MQTVFRNVLRVLFNSGYTLLTCFYLPGTNITPLQMIIGASICVLSIKLLKSIGGDPRL